MNLVYGSFCPLHEGNYRCPCRTLITNASIWTAAELGDADRVKMVVRVKGRSPDSLDPHGYTPLHLAAQNGRLAVVQYLLEAGASPDGVPAESGGCGATPLHRAAFAGQLPCVRALLAAGANSSAADTSFLDMKTPLHKAAAQGHRDICIALMEGGADPNTRDAAGNSALDVLDLSSPAFSDAALLSTSQNNGGGGGTGACSSTVVLSRGVKQDWSGVREALERHGGCRSLGGGNGARNDGGDGRSCDGGGHGDGGHGDGVGSASRNRSASGGALVEAGPELECTPVPPPTPAIASASMEAIQTDADAVVDVEGSEETLARPSSFRNQALAAPSKVDAVASPAPLSSKGQVANTSQSGNGSRSAGIPCGECMLPKMVMRKMFGPRF
eukprot:g15352.t1